MQQYYDLEMSIMSCLLLKPKLMEELKVEDKHFKKHHRLWQFMKAFYKKYETFDILMMYQICKEKYQIASYLQQLVELDPFVSRFNKYQEQLIELYDKTEKEKYIIEKIYAESNNLYVGNISLEQFKKTILEIEENAEKIYSK